MNKFINILISVAIIISCTNSKVSEPNDYEIIIQSDTLRVITLNTSTSYFIYRDQEMGYHYDMIKSFANEKSLELKVIVAPSNAALYDMLNNNEGDVVVYGMPIENNMKNSVLYSGLSEISHQVLIQRNERIDTLINDVTELIGKDVYVLKGSKYENRMENLNNELGGGIGLKHVNNDTLVVEDLIRMVSRGEIRYTIADENAARLNHTYFRNIDVDLPVSFDQRTSWAVRKDSPVLSDSLNAWFDRINKEHAQVRFIKRYFEESKGFHEDTQSSYISLLAPGQISHWDKYFKEYAKKYNLEWQLLASISFHESTFDPDVKSWAGAGGLMGLMPATARSMGIGNEELYIPKINIELGAQYLRNLIDIFSSVDEAEERMKLALASYNGGIGHISDARALAEKYDADKNKWEGNVEKYLQLKRLEQYYNDPVCKSGYFRADETVNYVQNVMSRWKAYKEKIPQ